MNTQNSSFLEEQIRRLRQTSPVKSGLFAGIYLTRLLAPWAAVIGSVAAGYVDAAPFLLIGSVLNTAICQRAFENLVHDASHYNMCRKSSAKPDNAKINDGMATVLVAAPVMQDIVAYRAIHDLHHKALGGEQDPCRKRQVMQLFDKGGKISRFQILRYAASHLLELNLEALQWENPRAWAAFVAWHVLVMIAPAAFIVGIGPAIFLWILYWQIPMTAILPMIRAVAERWEHNYAEVDHRDEDDDVEGGDGNPQGHGGKASHCGIKTFSNLSVFDRFIFHPAGDAYHAAHHAYPYIPAYRMRRLHKLLMKHKTAFSENPVRLD